MTDKDTKIKALEDWERTADPTKVYDDVEQLPDWWRKLVKEFEMKDLRPYQPSQLADGTIVQKEVEELEQRYQVEIELKAMDPTYNGKWAFFVDGSPIITAPHERKPQGYTEYGITSQELKNAISTELGGENSPQS